MPSREAVDFFKAKGEDYKVELIEDLGAENVSLYTQGSFSDLCRGPHLPSTSRIKAFRLTKVAGAYWRGDEKKAMLSRIYGVAFADRKKLKSYLKALEEVGVNHVALNLRFNQLNIEQTLHHIAEQVLPEFAQ